VCGTIEETIKTRIIGDKNADTYDECKSKMRIVILLDAYDEITIKPSDFESIITRQETNITFVLSTRPHKLDEIVPDKEDAYVWSVIQCNGIRNEGVTQMFASIATADKHKGDEICAALTRNNLNKNPLFILMSWQVFANEEFEPGTVLDMFTLMSRFYDVQLDKYYTVQKHKLDKLEQFYNTLGWYAIHSGAVEPINTLNEGLNHTTDHFSDKLQQEIKNKHVALMEVEVMHATACNAGLLSANNLRNVHDIRYSFMHKTVAEFAVAKLLYNTKLWKVADTLHENKWSMIHYYFLMHSIHTNHHKGKKLWKHQLTYAFINSDGKGNQFYILLST
jgi:hypothetical protein